MHANRIFGRKRELTDFPTLSGPIKKSKPEIEEDGRPSDKKYQKRKLDAVINELCSRVEDNDRQLTNNLLRELDSEHVRKIDEDQIVPGCKKLLQACISTKLDTISQKILRTLVSIIKDANEDQWVEFLDILGDDEICDSLFAKCSLDCQILDIYTHALDNKYIDEVDIPNKVVVSGKRGIAQTNLNTTHYRSSSIKFLVAFGVTDRNNEQRLQECEKMLCRLSCDRDYRVRNTVIDGLIKLTEEGHRLSKASYNCVKTFLKDTDSTIRVLALKLLLYFGNRKPSETIDGKDNVTITDDAFSAMCDAMNDIEIVVRVEAAKNLGDFEDVSEELIYQTLDKKMMRSNKASEVVKVDKSMFAMSKKAPVVSDRRWRFSRNAQPVDHDNSRGGWSRGKELHAAAPQTSQEGEEEEEEDSIIPHGACGAFVSALEDEFMDVRKAAVYSLGRLATNRPSFAVSALEYLADMFNDEIAEVRLDAIKALTPLIAHGQLNSEQLNVILKCLDDGMPESRQAMRELLKRAQLSDVQCIELCVKSLLACLKRFPKDKEDIFSCMASIGYNHSVHIQAMMRNLLGIHLLFQTKEHSTDDVNYLCKLIMVLNAASQQQSMVYVMPEFVQRHYRFLRTSSPHLVHPIRIIDEQQNGKIRQVDIEGSAKAQQDIVLKTYGRLCESATVGHVADRNILRENIYGDASAISAHNENVSGAARLICCLGEIAIAIDNVTNTVLCGGEIQDTRNRISQHIADIQSIEYQFSGISSSIHCYLAHCQLFLSIIDMIVWILEFAPSQNEIARFAKHVLTDIKKKLSEIENVNETTSKFVQNCERVLLCKSSVAAKTADDKKLVVTPAAICQLLEPSHPKLPDKFPIIRNLHLKYAQITTPNKDAAIENAIRFFSNMPHGIALEATFFNLLEKDLENLRVKITFPDGRFDLMKPREKDFRDVGEKKTVSTYVKVTSSSPWSDSAEIDIVLGLLTASNNFVPLLSSPSSFSPAHVRVKIHPIAR